MVQKVSILKCIIVMAKIKVVFKKIKVVFVVTQRGGGGEREREIMVVWKTEKGMKMDNLLKM
jgi:hypothetical protein